MNAEKVAAHGCTPNGYAGGFGGLLGFHSFQPHDFSFQTLPNTLPGTGGFKMTIQEDNMQPLHSLLHFQSAEHLQAE